MWNQPGFESDLEMKQNECKRLILFSSKIYAERGCGKPD